MVNIFVEEAVRGFQVTVDKAVGMEMIKTCCDVPEERDDLIEWQLALS